MMTTKKADTRKKTTQTKARYQTVRILRKRGENLADRLATYKTRYIEEPVKDSKAFMEDLNADPRKTLENLADESRDRLADLRKESRRKVDNYLKDGRKLYRKARKAPRKTLDGVVEDSRTYLDDLSAQTRENVDEVVEIGRELMEGLEKDSRMVIDRLQAHGKEALEKFTGRETAGKAQPLLIKKYVNGRFYDTVNKKYLKKEDLARLVKKEAAIKVIYTKTGRNITRAVVASLAADSKGDKSAFLSIDELTSWLKKNQKRIRETIDRQVNTVRKAVKMPA
jgi:hypothetical protein